MQQTPVQTAQLSVPCLGPGESIGRNSYMHTTLNKVPWRSRPFLSQIINIKIAEIHLSITVTLKVKNAGGFTLKTLPSPDIFQM